jgi:hypothetical protein
MERRPSVGESLIELVGRVHREVTMVCDRASQVKALREREGRQLGVDTQTRLKALEDQLDRLTQALRRILDEDAEQPAETAPEPPQIPPAVAFEMRRRALIERYKLYSD